MTRSSWHHAYNGVPTLRRRHPGKQKGFADDYAPCGQDHLQPEALSGEIGVSITVVSPTVPGQRTGDGRVVVASREGAADGAQRWDDATIPVTTLKGVLSSAYEAVTASRMRVFTDHDRVLTHRRTTQEAAVLYPVFLVPDTADSGGTGLRVRVMLGKNQHPEQGRWNEPGYVCAAVLPDSEESRTALYDESGQIMHSGAAKKSKRKRYGSTSEDVLARLAELRAATPHLSQVRFSVQEEKFYSKKRLVVAEVNGERFCGTVKGRDKKPQGTYVGHVVRLTPEGSDRLIDTKYNEFIFFDTKKNRTYLPVPSLVLEHLVEVIHSYLENIRLLKLQESRRRSRGPSTESKTRRSYDPRTWLIDSILSDSGPGLQADRSAIEQHLRSMASQHPGVPLFASVSKDGDVTGLSLSQVGRRVEAGALAPVILAEAGGITPARDYDQASPADRMWGFVADEKTEGLEQAPAVRGRVTIRPVLPCRPPEGVDWLKRPEGGSTGWVLPTLASPKPSTGVPYLHTADGRALPPETTRSQTYRSGQLLTRKVYPSHRPFIDRQLEDLPGATSLTGTPEAGQSVVGSYLAPGARFTTTISFVGLTKEELAILVWLLSPERLVPRGRKDAAQEQSGVGFHRLGLGKPLGLGMVEIRATDVVTHTGTELARMYSELTGCLGTGAALTGSADRGPRGTDAWLEALPEDFESRPAVRAFVRAAFGWEDGAAVRYPDAHRSAAEGDVSPITAWFKAREENRVNFRSGSKKDSLEARYDLPDLIGRQKD